MTGAALARVLDALAATTGYTPRGSGNQHMARCPAHPDNKPSLSITDTPDRVLLKCQATCNTDDVLAQLNLTYADLYNQPRPRANPNIVTEYEYVDEQGQLLFVVERRKDKTFIQKRRNPNGGGWLYKLGDTRRVLYRLPEVLAALEAARTVYIVEGEKDADRLRSLGLTATCNPAGAGKWRTEYATIFATTTGADVVIIRDRDAVGTTHADQVAASLTAIPGVHVRLTEPAVGKDISNHLDEGGGIDDVVTITDIPAKPIPAPPPPTTAAATTPLQASLPTFDPRTAPREAILRGLIDTPEQAHWDDEPENLEGEGDPPQPCPIDALPPDLGEYIAAVADNTQTPADMVAMLVFSSLAIVAANRYWVAREYDWIEPLVLWTLTALPPGSRKSAVSSRVARPLYAIEREVFDLHREQSHGKDDLLTVAAKRKERILNDLVKVRNASEKQNLEAELADVRDEIEALTVPPARQLLCDDITPEALGILLQENDGHIGIMSAEGGVFASLTGRYTQGTPQLDLILKSYDGDPYRANRVGRSKVVLDHPAVVLGLAVQPHVLAETTKTPALRERGLMGRLSYAVPVDTVGSRAVITPQMPEEVERRWHDTLVRISRAPVYQPDQPRRTLWLDVEALELHRSYQETLEPRLHDRTGDLAFMSDWAGKHAGRVLRIAGLLHLAANGDEHQPVTFKTMCAAVDIGDWMLTHAVAVYGGWRSTNVNAPSTAVLDWLRRTKPTEFTVNDVRTALRGQTWCSGAQAVKDALVILARAGWVSSVRRLMADGKRSAGAGMFIPHPALLVEEDDE